MGDVFKALADPTRRTILDEPTERDGQTLVEICSRLALRHLSSSRQAISQHLAVPATAQRPMSLNSAPVGSAAWARRPYGVSSGGWVTFPRISTARASVASTSSTTT